MPYIKQTGREVINPLLESLNVLDLTDGDLNYIFTTLILAQLQKGTINYQAMQNKIGALECCKLELYRRLAAPYEDIKAKENGDVY